MQIQCEECAVTYHVKGNLLQRHTEQEGVTEWGFLCPNCRAWRRAYFESVALRGLRYKVTMSEKIYQQSQTPKNWERYTTARAEFRLAFDALQQEMTTP